MKQAELESEVFEIIDGRLRRGLETVTAWLVQQVIANHPDVEGDDEDFYILCAAEHTDGTVRKVLARFKDKESDPDPQLVLPGFERLQRGYMVEREGERRVIPLDAMTATEITDKADLYERLAGGCLQHARELRRFSEAKFTRAS